MAELKVKFNEEQMRELVARVIEHFAIDHGNITEIVRCKNCKRRNKYMICPMWDQKLSDYDYCSYGERKEE